MPPAADAVQTALYPSETSRVMGVLLQIARVVEKRLEEGLEAVDLSVAKYSALKHLALAGEPLPLSELASRMVCVRSNITQLMGRLEADGLVQRVEDPHDRRCVRAELTPLGRERQAAGARRVRQVQDKMAATLCGLDSTALERALAALK
ncbi:MAG TPA: MarR family transcriptional regulator [Thermoanaerobaculia bacterium]|jgi:DNA-binding MarR family transcriptional regulator|nr:MarR family transcriptional regulator [Thermoanaerobaculia bacterium]